MAQHSGVIADQAGLAFLSDLNNALLADKTLNSGATEPTTKYAGMLWLDTSGATPVLKLRNQANSGWDNLSALIDAEILPSPIASGYVKRKSDNSGNETKTAQQVADEIGPLTALASEAAAGRIEVATQTETDAGSADNRAVTPKKLRWGFSASLTTNGYIVFPSWLGGLIVQWGTDTATGAGHTVTFPMAFPTQCFAVSCFGMGTGTNWISTPANPTLTGYTQSFLASGGSSGATGSFNGRFIAVGV